MTKNSLFIHIELGNTFYQNFNTNENFFNFILAQQDNNMAPYLKELPTTTALRNTAKSFYHHFP